MDKFDWTSGIRLFVEFIFIRPNYFIKREAIGPRGVNHEVCGSRPPDFVQRVVGVAGGRGRVVDGSWTGRGRVVDGSWNIIISYYVQKVCSKVETFEEK